MTDLRCRCPGWGCTRPCAVRAEADALDRQGRVLTPGTTVADQADDVLPGDVWSLAGILLFVGSQQQLDDPTYASVAKLQAQADRGSLIFCQRTELVKRVLAGWKARTPTAPVLLERRAQVPVLAEDPSPGGL